MHERHKTARPAYSHYRHPVTELVQSEQEPLISPKPVMQALQLLDDPKH